MAISPIFNTASVLSKVTPVTGTTTGSGSLTVTTHSAVLWPSSVVTVTVASPAATAVTTPPFTLAMASSLLAQLTFLFVASAGAMVAAKVAVSPILRAASFLSKVTLVTGTTTGSGSPTVTTHLAVFWPSSVVTVMVASPAATAVTTPSFTVAMASSLLAQLTFLLVAFAGAMVVAKVAVSPIFRAASFLSKVTPVTGTTTGSGSLTVTTHSAVFWPSSVVTVMVALPTATAVTTPSFTVAMASSLLTQLTFLFVASAGATVAAKVTVSPIFKAASLLSKVTPVTPTAAFTGSVKLFSSDTNESSLISPMEIVINILAVTSSLRSLFAFI